MSIRNLEKHPRSQTDSFTFLKLLQIHRISSNSDWGLYLFTVTVEGNQHLFEAGLYERQAFISFFPLFDEYIDSYFSTNPCFDLLLFALLKLLHYAVHTKNHFLYVFQLKSPLMFQWTQTVYFSTSFSS